MSEKILEIIGVDLMRVKASCSFLVLLMAAGWVFVWNESSILAQTLPSNGIFMFGNIDNDLKMSGYFGKNSKDLRNKNWCVFIGANEKVYKLSLIERNIHELYIDGQKIADSQIWKHNAEYKSFLERFWRNEEIENESRDLEQQIKPLDRKIEAISKEVEKLDMAEEKLDKESGKTSFSLDDDRKIIQAQQKRLNQIHAGLDRQIEGLSKQEEKLSEEQKSLKLMDDLNKVLQQIGADIQSLGAAKNSKNISYKLSNLELIVNNKRVSDEVFKIMKARYILDLESESGFLYRWKGDF